MKRIYKITGLMVALAAVMTSCSDYEEINTNPFAANDDQVQVEYFINNSIIGAQQNPHVAERAFVLYWKAAARFDRTNSLPVGSYSDGWTVDYFNSLSSWLNHINTAIQVADQKMATGNVKEYSHNLVQVARIWRVYLMSEMTDNFGPIPINAFQGENPEFNSTQEVYYYMLEELKDAQSQLELEVTTPGTLANLDPAYKYNWEKWKKYANSMRMRLAMRMSEVDPEKAQLEFEDAVAGSEIIMSLDETFKVQEKGGWDDLTAVMSREWNSQMITPTLNNIFIGLGGLETTDILGESYEEHVKPEDWLGLKFENHFTTKTNDPSAGYWFDGLHKEIDPRAYQDFAIPGDFNDSDFSFYPSWTNDARTTQRNLVDANGDIVKELDAAFTWNASALGSWGEKGSKNQLYSYSGTIPRMAQKFRSGGDNSYRIFFAPWESYFLIAEAATRGWSTPVDAMTAYEAGIRSNFDYFGIGGMVDQYLASEEYNRNGTSVNWNHTSEPGETHLMEYENGYTGAEGTVEVVYPDNDLYMNGNVKNDHLTKIITQKYIAFYPYLPLEAWNDHRRLGLPFFENPAVENSLPDLPALTSSNFMEAKKEFFPQRLKYPSALRNNDPEGYQQAVQLLDGEDAVFTPLWWAQK
jgi:hypothetical protein